MLQRLSIRGKILAVVAVPILVLIAAAVYLSLGALNDLNQARTTSALLGVVERAKTFNEALRDEGDASSNYISAWSDYGGRHAQSVEDLDLALATMDDLASAGGADAAMRDAVRQALQGGQELPDGSLAMSLDEARGVWPTGIDGGEYATWPEQELVDRMAASYDAMEAAVRAIATTASVSPEANTVLTQVIFLIFQEGDRAEVFLTETPALQEEFVDAQEDVDSSWKALEALLPRLPRTDQTANAIATLDIVETELRDLNANRERTRDRAMHDNSAHLYYFTITSTLVGLTETVSPVVNSPQIAQWLDAYGATDELLEAMAIEDNKVDRFIRAGTFQQGENDAAINLFAQTDFVRNQATRSIDSLNAGLELPELGANFEQGSQTDYRTVRNRVANAEFAVAAAQDWPSQVQLELDLITPLRDQTLDTVRDRADDVEQATLLTTVLTAIAAFVIVALSIVIALTIARRIIGPLRRLTTTATAVRQELPRLVERVALPGERVDVSEVQIPVESSDEVGRLAEAFNSVNAATLAIASEQAALRGSISEMFVNVARRDQVLLNRQLSSIDEMERTEDNPDTLTKLFALDHLATRMRRNSESLLVLAGIDTGRRLRRPMPLSDVIRTASSEIELYERVQLELDADPAMVGHSALTAAHLFAELLENATVFSDPGTPVVVQTAAEGNGYVVRIIDSGIGMTPEELAEANARVASSAASEILGAQRLGLFVVGRIARRIGARVEIMAHEGEGTVATITMPPSLFDSSASAPESSAYSPSTVDEQVHAPSALVTHDLEDEVLDAQTSVASAAERAGAVAASVGSYQPDAIQSGTSLSGRATGAQSTVEDLVAADALNAPMGEPVDLDALTEGVGATGLPTRRRKSSVAEADRETNSILGLPSQPTDAQLTALTEDVDSGFTPLVAASELAPQTAEQRAAMFRGFRARRGGEPEVELAPDAESLGQAVRRGAAPVPEDSQRPSIELEADLETSFAPPGFEDDEEPVERNVRPAAEQPPVVRQSPLISSGYEHEDSPAVSATFEVPQLDIAGAVPTRPAYAMEIPAFEDDEPSDSAPALDDEPVYDSAGDQAGISQVMLEEPSVASAVPEPVARESLIASVAQDAEPVAAAAQAPEPAPAAAQAHVPFTHEPVTSSPSLDDLIMGGAASSHDARGGFFSKLFRKSKGDDEAAPSPAPYTPPAAPLSTTGGIPVQPAPAQAPWSAGAPVVTPATPASGSINAFAPQGEFAADPHTGGLEVPGTSSWPVQDQYAGPSNVGSLTPAAGATPYNPGTLGGEPPLYSRDDLARPLGWETAGASALQAAAPDQAASYQPSVQMDPGPVGEDEDMASSVFSELSSLSSERPKVERTKVGLQRRRPADAPAPEVTPIEDVVDAPRVSRDADTIRSRFSSFYSGTQRARTDVAEFERSTQDSLS
jgi:signal transduction histidine kinase